MPFCCVKGKGGHDTARVPRNFLLYLAPGNLVCKLQSGINKMLLGPGLQVSSAFGDDDMITKKISHPILSVGVEGGHH